MPRRSKRPVVVRNPVRRELRRIVDDWVIERTSRERQQGGEHDGRQADGHLDALRVITRRLVSYSPDRRRTLSQLADVSNMLRFYAWFYGEDKQTGRPRSWETFKARCRSLMKRHHTKPHRLEAPDLATFIIRREVPRLGEGLLPDLPDDARREVIRKLARELKGDYPDEDAQIEHLADRLRRNPKSDETHR